MNVDFGEVRSALHSGERLPEGWRDDAVIQRYVVEHLRGAPPRWPRQVNDVARLWSGPGGILTWPLIYKGRDAKLLRIWLAARAIGDVIAELREIKGERQELAWAGRGVLDMVAHSLLPDRCNTWDAADRLRASRRSVPKQTLPPWSNRLLDGITLLADGGAGRTAVWRAHHALEQVARRRVGHQSQIAHQVGVMRLMSYEYELMRLEVREEMGPEVSV